MLKKISIMMFALVFALIAGGHNANAVSHFVSGALAELGVMEEETSITPEYLESLFVEQQKLEFFGEAAQELEAKLAPLKSLLNEVNETIGSANFSPFDMIGEDDIVLNSAILTTVENPSEMSDWLNDTLVLATDATHEDKVQNSKELAILRNGALTTQYSQALRMYLDMDDRAKGLYNITTYDASGEATAYQAFLSSYEARIYELNTDRLYMQSLGVISANTDYMASNHEVFVKNAPEKK